MCMMAPAMFEKAGVNQEMDWWAQHTQEITEKITEEIGKLNQSTARSRHQLVAAMERFSGPVAIPTGFDIVSGYMLHGHTIRCGVGLVEQIDILHVLCLSLAADKLHKFMCTISVT
jgi:hypothetical protein